MPNDINELDVNDIGLKGIFGERFQDETQEEVFTRSPEVKVEWCERKAKDIPVEAQWCPAKAEPSLAQRLMNAAKWTGFFGCLSWIFFYWQESGQMHPSAAVPCMCACTAMVGWAIGKNMVGGKKK